MKLVRFEDLECWKEARKLMQMIYNVTQKGQFQKDFELRNQFLGAGISIMNNIAEGFDSQSNSEFIRFLRYSRRSVSEVQNCLYIAFDQSYIEAPTLNNMYEQASIVRKIIDGFIRYLRNIPKTG